MQNVAEYEEAEIVTCHFTIISPGARSAEANRFIGSVGIANSTDSAVLADDSFAEISVYNGTSVKSQPNE